MADLTADLTEAYADQFLCGEAVLLGRFKAVRDYGAPQLVGYRSAPLELPKAWPPADCPAIVTADRAVFEVGILARASITATGYHFQEKRVVRLRPSDDPAYLRGWQAAYYG